MSDRPHVVAVIDKSSRFPAAKIIQKAVTVALSQINADYGDHSSHQTNNVPPFNLEGFANFSAEARHRAHKTYPYHIQPSR